MSQMDGFGRWLIFLGLSLALMGAALVLLPKVPWFGRLPGDIIIQRRHVTVFVPITTCLLLSLGASLTLWFVGRFFGRFFR